MSMCSNGPYVSVSVKRIFFALLFPDLLSNINRFLIFCDGEKEWVNESANGNRVCFLFLFEMHGHWCLIYFNSSLLSLPLTSLIVVAFFCVSIYRSTATCCCESWFIWFWMPMFLFFFIELLCPISSRSLEFWFVICGVFSYNCDFCVHAMIRTVSVKLCSYRTESLTVHILSKRSTFGVFMDGVRDTSVPVRVSIPRCVKCYDLYVAGCTMTKNLVLWL